MIVRPGDRQGSPKVAATSDAVGAFRAAAPGWLLLAAMTGLGFLFLGHGLPSTPWLASDSESYLRFSPVRPHGYSLFLAAYRLASPDLVHLPAVQLGLFLGAVLLLAAAVWRRTRSVLLGAALLLVVFAAAEVVEFSFILSDPLYAAALTAGFACFVFYAETRRPAWLVGAAAGFGVALVCRAIGLALLPAVLLAVVAAHWGRRRELFRAVVLTALPVAALYCAAASSQLLHNGRFAIGNWGGMDVVGKLPLLSRPVAGEQGRLNGILEMMQPARAKLQRLSPLVEALAARQYYEYLKWYVILPQLEKSWPDWRTGDEYRRGMLAAQLAERYIAQDPLGYLRRCAIDFAGLWAMPRRLTPAEDAAAVAEVQAIGGLPLLDRFAQTADGRDEYYKVVPGPTDPVKVVVFRVAVAGFWLSSLGFVLAASRRRIALGETSDLLLLLVVVHGLYLGTALMEGVHARYVMPTWPALVAAVLIAARAGSAALGHRVCRRVERQRFRP